MMMRLYKTAASVGGIGYVKGGGTFAAIVYCLIWYLLPAGFSESYWQVISTVVITVLGTWCADAVEPAWGKDSSKVVIDEVAGMAVTLLYVPHTVIFLLSALVLFRFFDIVKPLGIRKTEKLPGGTGVMADDILSGVYALILLQLFIRLQPIINN